MKRMGHGSLYPAELASQPFKRADGFGVGQDDVQGTPAGDVGGLPFGFGLGLHGSGADGVAQGDEAALFLPQLAVVSRSPDRAEPIAAGGPKVDGAKAAVLLDGDGHGSSLLGLAAQFVGGVAQHGDVRGVGLLGLAALGLHLIGAAVGNEIKEGGLGVVVAGFGFHGFLRVGPIPTMWRLLHVCTDKSTPSPYRSSGSRFVNHGLQVAA